MNSAELSQCGKYRYTLTRLTVGDPARKILFVMLNPSTATAAVNDPTIRRCMKLAERENCGLMSVVNLFSLRSKSPRDLHTPENNGPESDWWIARFAREHVNHTIVCAWGSHGSDWPGRVEDVLRLMRGELKCLGLNKDGTPKHPLYLRGDTPLQYFRGVQP